MPREITVLLDESKRGPKPPRNAITLVGATILELSTSALDARLSQLFERTKNRPSIEESGSYKLFTENGFHRKDDTAPMQIPFIEEMEQTPGYKSMIFFSEAPTQEKDASAAHAALYWQALRAILREFRYGANITLLFEQNPSLKLPRLKQIAEAAKRASGFRGGLRVEDRKKRDPDGLAIVDYTLGIFGSWWMAGETQDGNKREYAEWRAIRGTVSVVHSTEHGALYRRGQPTGVREREARRRSTTLQGTHGSDSLPQDGRLPSPAPSVATRSAGKQPPPPLDHAYFLARANISEGGLKEAISAVQSGEGYTYVQVRKRRRGTRRVAIPAVEVKSVQKRACAALESHSNYSAPVEVHGYTPGKSSITNAYAHATGKSILAIDLLDFFSTITTTLIVDSLVANGCTLELAQDVAAMSCIDDRLAQGFATSPFISNVAFQRTDRALGDYARAHQLSYTRYADDLTFSGDVDDENLEQIAAILDSHDWTINPRKTRFMRPGGAQYVTGVYVGRLDELRAPRRVKRALRQAVHYIAQYGFDATATASHPRLATRARLVGTLRYVASFPQERATVERLWAELECSSVGIRRGRLERRFPRDATLEQVLAMLDSEVPHNSTNVSAGPATADDEECL